jgi:hypothetical protein
MDYSIVIRRPLTKWQKTVQDVCREYREAGEYISFGDATKIASERYLIACIEEDNMKHPDARRSARLQKKASLTAPPAKPAPVASAPPAEPTDFYPLAFAVPIPEDYECPCEHCSSNSNSDYDDDCDSIYSPLTDEEVDAALAELEKNDDY